MNAGIQHIFQAEAACPGAVINKNVLEVELLQISSRFTIAIHIFACMETFGKEYKITSDFLASSINVNPVIIRKILSQLKDAGLIDVARGTGGTTAARPIDQITFYDIYMAVDLLEEGELFHFHENPNPGCPVGRNIHAVLDDRLKSIQEAMENEMKKYTIANVANDIEYKVLSKKLEAALGNI